MGRTSRRSFDSQEDVRMLKWVARKADPPLGVQIWKKYVEHYAVQHTPQSLNGRMRRMILPNICEYLPYLNVSEVEMIYNTFINRFDAKTRKRLRKHVLKAPEQRFEESCENSEHSECSENSDMSFNDLNDNDEEEPPRPEVPEVRLQQSSSSIASTVETREHAEKTFSIESWNADMRPVAESAVKTLYEHMCQIMEGRTIPQQELENLINGDSVQQLFDKMFREEEQQSEENIVIVSVAKFTDKQLRFKYFVRIQNELKKYKLTVHIRSAILAFFQYFEYTVASAVEDIKTYTAILDLVVQLAMDFAIL